MLQGLLLIPAALILDGLQAVILAAFAGLSFGATSILAFVPILGPAITASATGAGFGAGYVVDVSLTFGFGSLMLTLLMYCKMFYPRWVAGVTLAEIALPFLPGWTLLVIRSLLLKHKEEAQQLDAQTA